MRFFKDTFYNGTYYLKDVLEPDKYMMLNLPADYFETKRDWRRYSRNEWAGAHMVEITTEGFLAELKAFLESKK